MFQERQAVVTGDLLNASRADAERRVFQTLQGPVFLHPFCPSSVIEGLQADEGLRMLARRPEREYQLLLDLARRPGNVLALAYTPDNVIVGQVTLAPTCGWWQGLPNTYEIAIEVSSFWRRLGLARQLLRVALDLATLEHLILLATGFVWHWDLVGLDLHPFRYRALVAHLFASHAFVEYLTEEPNVCDDRANILLARIGSQVDRQLVNQFLSRLVNGPCVGERTRHS